MAWLGGQQPQQSACWVRLIRELGRCPNPTARTTPTVPCGRSPAGSQRLVAQADGPDRLCNGPD
jgi:hypothetical protein